MIIFENFLCCLPLKVFGKLIGWFGATISIVFAYLILLIVLMMSPDKMHEYKSRFSLLENIKDTGDYIHSFQNII